MGGGIFDNRAILGGLNSNSLSNYISNNSSGLVASQSGNWERARLEEMSRMQQEAERSRALAQQQGFATNTSTGTLNMADALCYEYDRLRGFFNDASANAARPVEVPLDIDRAPLVEYLRARKRKWLEGTGLPRKIQSWTPPSAEGEVR